MSSTLRALADSLATGLQSVTWGITSTTVERKNWANIDVDAMASPRRRARAGVIAARATAAFMRWAIGRTLAMEW